MRKRSDNDPWADYQKFQERRWDNTFLPVNVKSSGSFFGFEDFIGLNVVLVLLAIFVKSTRIFIIPIILLLWLVVVFLAYRQRKANNSKHNEKQNGSKSAT